MLERSATTTHGSATRARIVEAASKLINERGVAAVSLGDVRVSAGVSQSQLYHYFGDRDGVIQAAVDNIATQVVSSQIAALEAVNTWAAFERWCALVVAGTDARGARGGCPVGTLAAALADTDEPARGRLSDALARWRSAILGALDRIRDGGEISRDADIDELATFTLAAIQGDLLLAKTERSAAPLRAALTVALAALSSST